MKMTTNALGRLERLTSLPAKERNHAALQWDRRERLAKLETEPMTEQQIADTSRELATTARLCRWFEVTPTPYRDTLARMLSGRIMSAGMEREATAARAYAAQVTDEEIAALRDEAIKQLHSDRDYLRARLGPK